MGKGRDKKKKAEKKQGKGKEKTEAKQKKNEKKKHKKELDKDGERDIEDVLAEIKKMDEEREAIHEEIVDRPSVRGNCTLTLNPNKPHDLILFGGEYYDGRNIHFYNDVHRYNVEKKQWKRFTSKNSPPPRSSHQAVAYKDHIFVFGGEFASPTQTQFHHFKDFWALDLNENSWQRMESKGSPSPRSGHRMVLGKKAIYLFGGFYDNYRETTYFNDLWAFDLENYKWKQHAWDKVSSWPSPRSGFQMWAFENFIYVYGGYYKEPKKKAKDAGDAKGVVHTDMWRLNTNNMKWEKMKKGRNNPGIRAGCTMELNKNRVILFGGVEDEETNEGGLKSTFYNEMYMYSIDHQRWFPLTLRVNKGAAGAKRRAKKKAQRQEKRAQAVAALKSGTGDGEGEEGAGDENGGGDDAEGEGGDAETKEKEGSGDEGEKEEATKEEGQEEEEGGDDTEEGKGGEEKRVVADKTASAAAIAVVGPAGDGDSEPLLPSGRISANAVIRQNTLFLYGGLVELGDEEITLDDMYSLNLHALDTFECLQESTVSTRRWFGEVFSDDEGSDDDEEEEEEESEGDDDSDGDSDGEEKEKKGKKPVREKVSKGQRQRRMAGLTERLNAEEEQRTPRIGEKLADFWVRTGEYWTRQAWNEGENDKMGKELRRDGFALALDRYDEMADILEEMDELMQDAKEEEDADKRRAQAVSAKRAERRA